MHKLLTKNIGVKLICFIAAAILWAYVSSSQNSIAKFPGSIKIKAFNSQQNLIAVYDTKNVEIKVMAESSSWKQLSADSFSAYIDLSTYSAGTYEVPVNVVSSIPGVQVVEKNPEKILVSLEPVIKKEVSITKQIEGNAAPGMTVGSVKFVPEKVWIEGAKSIVENTTEVIAKIVLNNDTEGFQRNITLSLSDLRYSDKEVVINPSDALADVAIIKGSEIKTVGIRANITGYPKNNYFVSSMTVTPSVIDITGPVDTLAKTKYLETMAVDIGDLSSSLSKDVQLQLPEGITIFGSLPLKIHINIEVLPNEVTKEFSIGNFRLIKPDNLDVKKYIPSELRVRCSGPINILNNLKVSDLTVILDFSNKIADSNGDIYFDLSPDNIAAPDGILIEILTKSIVAQIK